MGVRVKPKIPTELLFEDIKVNRNNAPYYVLGGSEVDIWGNTLVSSNIAS